MRIAEALGAICGCVALAGSAVPAQTPSNVQRSSTLMGTSLEMQVEGHTRDAAIAASEAALRACERVEARWSTWREDSVLARINAASVGVAVPHDAAFGAVLDRLEHIVVETGGAFDPGVGALVDVWQLRAPGEAPRPPLELCAGLAEVGWAQLRRQPGAVQRADARLRLEEGGFAKGLALDAAIGVLREAGVVRARLDFGGQVAVLGEHRVGLAHPDERGVALADVVVRGGSLATAGNSERGVQRGGARWGHLLDPHTGEPVEDFGSVTVWAESALRADALATALFVMGPDAALAWGAGRPGVEVLVARREDGGAVRVETTPGWPADRAASAPQDPDLAARVRRLEQENQELRARQAALEEGFEELTLGDVVRPLGAPRPGLGAAAAKVYEADGLSVGGYGELLFEQRSGGTDILDALRTVLYVGYRFDERFLVNTEIELEHGSTSSSSETTSSGGEVSLEFGYLDWLCCEAFNLRAGMLLVPVGLINERHEPLAFPAAHRPQTETRIIPSTWRELGFGAHGTVAGLSYRAYVVGGMSGERFSAAGLRGGRQKGNRAAADSFAGVLRVDWERPGWTLGGAVYHGGAGQDRRVGGAPIDELDVTLAEVHTELMWRGLWLRGLYAHAWVDGARALNAATGAGVASRLTGHYVELGYDLLAAIDEQSNQALYPFCRYERIDTQAGLPAGASRVPGQADTVWTVGLHYRPIDSVVLKADYELHDDRDDRFSVVVGYAF